MKEDMKLVEATKELAYEFRMLTATALELATHGFGTLARHNAYVESFAIHARALFHFFWDGTQRSKTSPRPDDIVAIQFREDWATHAPEVPASIEPVRDWTNKRVAHLTYERLKNGVDWPCFPIARDFHLILKSFLSGLDPELRLYLTDLSPAVLENFQIEMTTTTTTAFEASWHAIDVPVVERFRNRFDP